MPLFMVSCREGKRDVSIGCRVYIYEKDTEYLVKLTTTDFKNGYRDITTPVLPKRIEVDGCLYEISSGYISKTDSGYVVSIQFTCNSDEGVKVESHSLSDNVNGGFVVKLSEVFKVSKDKIKVVLD